MTTNGSLSFWIWLRYLRIEANENNHDSVQNDASSHCCMPPPSLSPSLASSELRQQEDWRGKRTANTVKSVTIIKTFRQKSPSFKHVFLLKTRKHECSVTITTKHASNSPVTIVTKVLCRLLRLSSCCVNSLTQWPALKLAYLNNWWPGRGGWVTGNCLKAVVYPSIGPSRLFQC